MGHFFCCLIFIIIICTDITLKIHTCCYRRRRCRHSASMALNNLNKMPMRRAYYHLVFGKLTVHGIESAFANQEN